MMKTTALHYYCFSWVLPGHQPSSSLPHVLTLKKMKRIFKIISLDDNHWITDPVPERCQCIHEHSQPHSLCCCPCPYTDSTPASYQDTLDLSDVSDLEDVMTTSSDEDIPALEDIFGL